MCGGRNTRYPMESSHALVLSRLISYSTSKACCSSEFKDLIESILYPRCQREEHQLPTGSQRATGGLHPGHSNLRGHIYPHYRYLR